MRTLYLATRGRVAIGLTAGALALVGCGGGDGTPEAVAGPAAQVSSASARAANPPLSTIPNTEGRLLASNCFQCHGTMGTGGFDRIRGSEASEVLEYMSKTANRDIMAAHAQGYTPEQLRKIIAYLQQ